MSVFANIHRLLDEKLKTLPSSPYVSWPNAEVRPGNAQLTEYIRPTLLLASTELNTLSGTDRIPGIYQVDIFGQLNRGIRQVYNIADEIKEHFSATRTLTQDETKVYIQNINLGQAQREDAWFRVFVEVEFICYNN